MISIPYRLEEDTTQWADSYDATLLIKCSLLQSDFQLSSIQFRSVEVSYPWDNEISRRHESESQLSDSHTSSNTSFGLLPPEIRLKIWACAVEPRFIPLVDLVEDPESYTLPAVGQLNAEARTESRHGYEHIGNGSYYHFGKDFLVWDYNFRNKACNTALEKLAERIERVICWDCIPDERLVHTDDYAFYLSMYYRQEYFGQIHFDKFWFPNVRELWFVKIGDVDKSWMVFPDQKATTYMGRLQQLAREFRYWVDERIIEIVPLELTDSDSKAVLREGRCSRENCRDMNNGRDHIVSKVNFMDGKYRQPNDGRAWVKILSEEDEDGAGKEATINRTRWMFVERALTFQLKLDWPDTEEGSERNRKSLV